MRRGVSGRQAGKGNFAVICLGQSFEFIEAHKPHSGLLERFGPEQERSPESTNSNTPFKIAFSAMQLTCPIQPLLGTSYFRRTLKEPGALSISIKDRSFPPKKCLTSFSFL